MILSIKKAFRRMLFSNVRFLKNYIFFTAAAKRETFREAFFL